jgi:hypothetical protein
MLCLTMLRRFDAVLEPAKAAVFAASEKRKDKLKDDALDGFLKHVLPFGQAMSGPSGSAIGDPRKEAEAYF